MTLAHKKQKTVLVVNSDLGVLVLMRGILQNDYRVLLAADAQSAMRLFAIGVAIDLAVVDRHLSGSDELERRMTQVSPEARMLSMSGFVEDGVVRLKAFDASHQRISESLIQRISGALAGEGSDDATISEPGEVIPEAPAVRKVMVAGRVYN